MRVLVPLDEAVSFRPGPGDTGHYKVALTLLAILVGFPNQAAIMFRELLKADDTSWPAFCTRLTVGHVETRHANDDEQSESKRPSTNNGPTPPARHADRQDRGQGRPDDDEPEEWARLFQYLGELTEKAKLPTGLGPYQHWCRRSARFSFQTGRLEAIMRIENESHR